MVDGVVGVTRIGPGSAGPRTRTTLRPSRRPLRQRRRGGHHRPPADGTDNDQVSPVSIAGSYRNPCILAR